MVCKTLHGGAWNGSKIGLRNYDTPLRNLEIPPKVPYGADSPPPWQGKMSHPLFLGFSMSASIFVVYVYYFLYKVIIRYLYTLCLFVWIFIFLLKSRVCLKRPKKWSFWGFSKGGWKTAFWALFGYFWGFWRVLIVTHFLLYLKGSVNLYFLFL